MLARLQGTETQKKTMKHLFFVKTAADRATFVERVLVDVAPRLPPLATGTIKVGTTSLANPRRSFIPLRRESLAMVSAWGDVDVAAMRAELGSLGDEVFGYRVEESYPRRYERDWADGVTSPGEVLLTLLVPSPKLSREAFMHEWHGRHTPKALRIHPMWSYARNVMLEQATEGAPDFAGVVEEHYRSLGEILSPVRFFGGPLRFIPQMAEVALHTNHFLDLRRTENYLLRERFVVTR